MLKGFFVYYSHWIERFSPPESLSDPLTLRMVLVVVISLAAVFSSYWYFRRFQKPLLDRLRPEIGGLFYTLAGLAFALVLFVAAFPFWVVVLPFVLYGEAPTLSSTSNQRERLAAFATVLSFLASAALFRSSPFVDVIIEFFFHTTNLYSLLTTKWGVPSFLASAFSFLVHVSFAPIQATVGLFLPALSAIVKACENASIFGYLFYFGLGFFILKSPFNLLIFLILYYLAKTTSMKLFPLLVFGGLLSFIFEIAKNMAFNSEEKEVEQCQDKQFFS